MSVAAAKLGPYETILPFERVEFRTYDKTILRGNLYVSATAQTKAAPIVIFCHGLGLLKEQYLENWFKHALQAGFHVLTYDHRSFGDSDGLPRNRFDWYGQAEDFVDAVTFARGLPMVDQDKVFGWGVAHAGGLIAMAAAIDRRITGIIMFLPCVDGDWDKRAWGQWLWEKVQANRLDQAAEDARADEECIAFWPLPELRDDKCVLSGAYVQEWSVAAQKMAVQGGNKSTFDGKLTFSSFWNDFHCRPLDYFDRITAPVLWVMATNDVVCGPLEFTQGLYDKLQSPKSLCVLEGEHLPQYFDQGFVRSVEATLEFLKKHTA